MFGSLNENQETNFSSIFPTNNGVVELASWNCSVLSCETVIKVSARILLAVIKYVVICRSPMAGKFEIWLISLVCNMFAMEGFSILKVYVGGP